MAACSVDSCESPAKARGFCVFHYHRHRRGTPLDAPRQERSPGPASGCCSVDGCEGLAKTKGLCTTHYSRSRGGRSLDAPVQKKTPQAGLPCSVEGCATAARRLGFCGLHYQRQRNGIPLDSPPKGLAVQACSVESCLKPAVSSGLCSTHTRRRERGQILDAPVRRHDPDAVCSVEGCETLSGGRKLCSTHYSRTRAGHPLTGPPSASLPVGTTRRAGRGYVKEKADMPDRWELQHRLRMEELLGRSLGGTENVHHCNGVRDDNRTDGPLVHYRSGNLELWTSAHPAGQRVADKVAHAREILLRYAPEQLTA